MYFEVMFCRPSTMELQNVHQSIEYFIQTETAASEVLELKEEILNLHKKMNEIREALAEVSKSDFEKGYMYEGALLMRQSRLDMIKKLKENFKTVNEDIKSKGELLKTKVFVLQDIEKQTPYSGKSLIPLDRSEMSALSQVWGAHV